MSNIFIVRHGQDEDNAHHILNGRRDKPLTPLGREQAKHAAAKLSKYHIAMIYSSPLKRAYETAQIIANTLHVNTLVKNDDMVERDFGILTGKTYDEIAQYARKRFQTEKVNYFLEAEGAETFPALYRRAQHVLTAIQKEHRNENVLLVTHGDFGKMLQAAYHGWTWKEGLLTPYLANSDILELSQNEDSLL